MLTCSSDPHTGGNDILQTRYQMANSGQITPWPWHYVCWVSGGIEPPHHYTSHGQEKERETNKQTNKRPAQANYTLRSALFWDITRRHVVTVYRRFGTTYQSHLQQSLRHDAG
jgi:hypothetical protein